MNDNKLPIHVGIIMDGNGRWAKKRGLSRSIGHKMGAKNLKKLLKHIYKRNIKIVSIYAFSIENFKRDKKEVEYLMDLSIKFFTNELKTFMKEKIKVLFSGRKDNLRVDVINAMNELEENTKNNTKGILNICFNYSGQKEIVDAIKKIAMKINNNERTIDDINEDLVSENMYQVLPPLDFVIRTSGELRTSNFMIWESSYAEYYFPNTLFPDFNEKEFDIAIEEFQKRNRRFGGIINENENN